MHTPAVLLQMYEAVADISGRMLEAARRDDWDAVIAEEQRVRVHIEQIRACTRAQGEVPLTPAEREARGRWLRRMLADDAEIRDLAQPWMRRLQDMLSSADNARRIDACYGGLQP